MKKIFLLILPILLLSCRGNSQEMPVSDTVYVFESDSTAAAMPVRLPRERDASDFVMVTDSVPDAILEIRYYSAYNFVGTRVDGYEAPVALLTREAAHALRLASDELREEGYILKIYDAYRPQAAVRHFVRWARDVSDTSMKRVFYPKVDKRSLFALGFISSRSSHSRGSTVDLTLVDRTTGREVDMGGVFDWFGVESHFDYQGLTAEQRRNRQALRNAMLHAGFKSIRTEWWHFTLRNEPYPNTSFDFPVNIL